MNTASLGGPFRKSISSLMGASDPHTLKYEGDNYETTDAYKAFDHARRNWLSVRKYVGEQATSSKRISHHDDYYGDTCYTFADGSMIVFAS